MVQGGMLGGRELGGAAEEAPPSLIEWRYSRAQIRAESIPGISSVIAACVARP